VPSLEAALFQELRIQSVEVVRETKPVILPEGGANASADAPITALPAGAAIAPAAQSQDSQPDRDQSGQQGQRQDPMPTVALAVEARSPDAMRATETATAAPGIEVSPGTESDSTAQAIAPSEGMRPEGLVLTGQTPRESREILARPTQGPESSQPPRPVQEIVKSYLANSGKEAISSELRLQLSPEHLGRVEVTVKALEGVITAVIRVEQPHAHEALEKQFGDLRQSLLDQGVRLDKVEVQLSQDSHHRDSQTDLGGGAWQQGRQQPGQDSRQQAGRTSWQDEDLAGLQFADGLPMMRSGSEQAGGFDTRA
jgi:flagellar hook-length control protein FliK